MSPPLHDPSTAELPLGNITVRTTKLCSFGREHSHLSSDLECRLLWAARETMSGYKILTIIYKNRVYILGPEVFTAVTMKNAVLWDVTPWRSCVNRRFGEGYKNPRARNEREQVAAGGDTHLRNVGSHNVYTVSHLRRRHSSYFKTFVCYTKAVKRKCRRWRHLFSSSEYSGWMYCSFELDFTIWES
jgi:hypothetical protein